MPSVLRLADDISLESSSKTHLSTYAVLLTDGLNDQIFPHVISPGVDDVVMLGAAAIVNVASRVIVPALSVAVTLRVYVVSDVTAFAGP